jgi:hypothetical protein
MITEYCVSEEPLSFGRSIMPCSVAGTDHIITMDLHASQIQVLAFDHFHCFHHFSRNLRTPDITNSGIHCRYLLRVRDILVRIRMRMGILGSVPLTNGSGCGSGRPKNIRIRMGIKIRNTGTFTSFFKDKKS